MTAKPQIEESELRRQIDEAISTYEKKCTLILEPLLEKAHQAFQATFPGLTLKTEYVEHPSGLLLVG